MATTKTVRKWGVQRDGRWYAPAPQAYADLQGAYLWDSPTRAIYCSSGGGTVRSVLVTQVEPSWERVGIMQVTSRSSGSFVVVYYSELNSYQPFGFYAQDGFIRNDEEAFIFPTSQAAWTAASEYVRQQAVGKGYCEVWALKYKPIREERTAGPTLEELLDSIPIEEDP